MRDRLIELIIASVKGCARNWAEVIADYLLANGVRGLLEKVYWYGFDGKIREATVKDEFVAKLENGFEYDIPYNDIGKTVFLTREEAEAKLKEGVQ